MSLDLNLEDISAIRVLGCGAMGTVFLATTSGNSSRFALKVVEKNSDESNRRARWEVSVLSRLDHPFLPKLLGSFETTEFIAWAVPFCPGGDLNALRYAQMDRVFSFSAIRFYVSEIVVALSHLHRLGIVYRDLKPENVLVQESGHVTLTDFDLSRHLSHSSPTPTICDLTDHVPKRTHRRNITRILLSSLSTRSSSDSSTAAEEDRNRQLKKAKSARVLPVSRRRSINAGEMSNSFVGTVEYVSPEVVRGDGHDFAVDWWALGILTYEMAYGVTPFRGRNRRETFHKILMQEPEYIGRQSTELTSFISQLLAKDPYRRLGSSGGAEEVKSHPFFHGVQWDLLASVTRPPYISDDVSDIVEDRKFDIRDHFMKQKSNTLKKETISCSSPSTGGSPAPSPSLVLFAGF